MKDILCVIKISSHGIQMRIFQKKGTSIKVIDKAVYTTEIGKEVFLNNKLSFYKIKEIIDTIKKMKLIAEGYQVGKIIVLGTNAIRKAKNNDYLEDQLRINTGLNIMILDKLDENYLAYEKISTTMEKQVKDYKDKNNLIIHIGSGNISFSIISNGIDIYNTNIEMGSLIFAETTTKLNLSLKKKSIIIDEYIKRSLNGIFKNITDINIERLILAGEFFDIYVEKVLNKKKIDYIESIAREDILEYNTKFHINTVEDLSKKCNIKKTEAESLLQKINIVKNILTKFSSENILFVNFKLSDVIAEYDFFKNEKVRKKIEKDSIESAKIIAKRYFYIENHVQKLEEIIEKIFNKIHKTHGLTKRDRYYLTLANIFKDTGKYINLENYINFSRDILEASGIFGLSNNEHILVSKILKYFNTDILELEQNKLMSKEEKLSISKLSAILRIAEALDSSLEQKINSLGINMDDDNIYFNVKLKSMIYLEKLEFEKEKEEFGNVFGLEAHLIINE